MRELGSCVKKELIKESQNLEKSSARKVVSILGIKYLHYSNKKTNSVAPASCERVSAPVPYRQKRQKRSDFVAKKVIN